MADIHSQYFEAAKDLPRFPTPNPDWSKDDPAHPGFNVIGLDNTPGKKGYFIHLEARPGKEEKLAAFIHDIYNGINQELKTGPWFALRYSKSSFAIFETFPDVAARNDHDAGPGGQNFFKQTAVLKEVLAFPAQLYRLDVLYGKTSVVLGQNVQLVE